jgi:ankyrin repeat protein
MSSIEALCWEAGGSISESYLTEKLISIISSDPDAARFIVNKRDQFMGRTLFHIAAFNRSPEFFRVLVECADNEIVTVADECGRLPVHYACTRNPYFETVKYLYEIHPESISTPDHDGWYPLNHYLTWIDYGSTRKDRLELMKMFTFLLKHSQAAFQANGIGWRSLHQASLSKKDPILLLKIVRAVYGAYPEIIFIRDNEGKTPVDMARIVHVNKPVVAFLETQLEFVNQARSVEIPNENGQLPIHQAVANLKVDMATIKLMTAANPASLMAIDGQGQTPFHIACQMGKCDIISYIMEKSRCVATAKNKDGFLPIQLLISNSNCDRNSIRYVEVFMQLFLIDPGMSIKALSKSNETGNYNKDEKKYLNHDGLELPDGESSGLDVIRVSDIGSERAIQYCQYYYITNPFQVDRYEKTGVDLTKILETTLDMKDERKQYINAETSLDKGDLMKAMNEERAPWLNDNIMDDEIKTFMKQRISCWTNR